MTSFPVSILAMRSQPVWSDLHLCPPQRVELRVFEGVPHDAIRKCPLGASISPGVIQAIEVAGVAAAEPPTPLVVMGTVARVEVVVTVLGTEGYVVMVAEGVP